MKKWKRPILWTLVIVLILCAGIAACLLTDPVSETRVSADNEIYCWLDYYYSNEMPWEETRSIVLEAFDQVTFHWSSHAVSAEKDGNVTKLYDGMTVWSVFFTDLNGDGYPELCSACSYGSGIVDDHVTVYDYKNMEQYYLRNRGEFDYSLELRDGNLWVTEKTYNTNETLRTGRLAMVPSNNANGWQLDIQYSDKPSPLMVPTTSTMLGPYDGYLFVKVDGQTYRYRRESMEPKGLTEDVLLDTYVETAFTGQSYYWKVFTAKEYPDRSVLLASVDGGPCMSFRYAPAGKVDDAFWQAIRVLDSYVVLENGDVTSGQKLWLDFAKKAEAGEKASICVAMYYTLDRDTCTEELYQTYAEDYPCLYLHEVRYDGSKYTVTWEENGTLITRSYQYLMHYYGKPESASASYKAYDKYVLTNDNTLTWEDIFAGMVSSQFGDYIDHYVVYNDYVWYKNMDKE